MLTDSNTSFSNLPSFISYYLLKGREWTRKQDWWWEQFSGTRKREERCRQIWTPLPQIFPFSRFIICQEDEIENKQEDGNRLLLSVIYHFSFLRTARLLCVFSFSQPLFCICDSSSLSLNISSASLFFPFRVCVEEEKEEEQEDEDQKGFSSLSLSFPIYIVLKNLSLSLSVLEDRKGSGKKRLRMRMKDSLSLPQNSFFYIIKNPSISSSLCTTMKGEKRRQRGRQ